MHVYTLLVPRDVMHKRGLCRQLNSTQSLFANNRKYRKNTTVQQQMAGCQRGLSLSKLATHGYNGHAVSLCLCVCLPVCHVRGLCQNE